MVARTTTSEVFGRTWSADLEACRSWRVTRWRFTEPPIALETIKPIFGEAVFGSGRRYPDRDLVFDLMGD